MDVIAFAGPALLIGALGSVHCVAMCGGIASALSMAGGVSDDRAWLQHACYGIGRVASYSSAGAFAGSIGFVAGRALGPDGIFALRVAAAVLLVLLGFHLAGWWSALAPIERAGAFLWRRIAPSVRVAPGRSGLLRSLTIGAAWGWLPCGLVYSTLAWAGASGDPIQAAVAMAAFGVGTLPGVWFVGLGAARFAGITRAKSVRELAGVFVMATALWTFVGALTAASGDPTSCHDSSVVPRSPESEVEHGVDGNSILDDVLAIER